MQAQDTLGALCLGRDWELEATCDRCGDNLGQYIAGRRVRNIAGRLVSDGQVILAERGTFTRVKRDDAAIVYGPRQKAMVRGPRTQVGVSVVEYEGTGYVLIRCGCGKNEKLSLGKLGRRLVTIRSDGSLVLAL